MNRRKPRKKPIAIKEFDNLLKSVFLRPLKEWVPFWNFKWWKKDYKWKADSDEAQATEKDIPENESKR